MSESHRSQRSVVAVVLAALVAGAPAVSTASVSSQRAPLTSREKALHVLNRLAFGPRPGDVDRVLEMGVGAWIEQQLKPEAIPDVAATARLKELPTLSMSPGEIFDTFEKPVREARRQRKAAAGTANEKMTFADAAKADAAAQEDIRSRIPPEKRPRRVIEELAAARLIRAAVSDRQLNEVLVDFWMNHFNVYAAKGLDRIFVTSFERDVVRPRIWGRFEDLLMATAKSPAMLFYLDNAQSVADPEHRPAPPLRRFSRFGRFGAGPAMTMEMEARTANRKGGLNENYARELMELHTLGVDGGYTQKDVTELARVLTGWSINPAEGSFVFRARVHDAGAKTVLGRRFGPGGGIEEGEQMISALARNRSTARHIAFQLCQRLVADAPPADLVDRVAKKFLSTDGDLRQTVRAVVASPEFFSPETYRAKVKSPFEYVASAIRAGGGETNARLPVVKEIAQMGEPLYLCQPPTGYSDAASAWVNAGALVARLNFAIALASNKLPGTEMDLGKLVSPQDAADPKRSVDALARVFLGGELTPETRQTIESQLENRVASPDDPSATSQLPLIAGLILGSPEFQRQ